MNSPNICPVCGAKADSRTLLFASALVVGISSVCANSHWWQTDYISPRTVAVEKDGETIYY